MTGRSVGVLWKEQDMAVELSHEFDGLEAYRQIREMMPPLGCVNRVVLDFSDVQSVETNEICCLLFEMAASTRFKNLEIRLEGLRLAQEGNSARDASSRGAIAHLESIMPN